ncbi:MAG TPA: LysR family transcriptional regulator [Ottowia sp.]|uniref:LysR family transcriptional regulator n=1 Tax=Ottowia sp. TaxID=1898956 RepID=UPI002C6593CF|nr:LysR family transcriptional regulator [Ottowia sp.]HNE59172.1 LysR family transcriptional regulator [Ottowia sp.]HNJ44661.1 LysR family transcriptional regulator [Ottowia sp.]HNK52180.1 LysR family transcriptional regulator [Ottowia sp.]HNL41238.1 LysR family transcriptional regulator [Ottowia sp.]HNO41008.1 LysR family transcriptional regulator [Ottowia sp.]
MNITLVQMRAFLALAESLSFTRAADSLGVTQPTLSATIRHLETAIGGRLFDRDTRKVALTALGLDCQRLARQLLSEVDRVEGQLRSHVLGRRGSVRIAAPANLFPNVLLPGLRAFRQANPGVRLEFADVPSDEAVHRLHAHQADLAIGVRAGGETGLRTQVVGQYPYVAILPDTHALAARRAIRWRDIQTEDVVVLQARDSLTSRIARTLGEAGVMPQAAYRVNELSTAAALVHGGFGVGLMSYWSAHQIFKPGLVIRMLSEPSLNGTIVLRTLPSVELSPQVRQLQEALRRHAPTLPRL